MSIHQITDFYAAVQIQDAHCNLLYEQIVDSEDAVRDFVDKYGKSRSSFSWLESTTIARTDRCTHVVEDLFFPSFVYFADKIHDTALSILTSIILVASDILTFPIRLCTLPYSFYRTCRYPEEEHAAVSLLNHSPLSQNTSRHTILHLQYEIRKPHREGDSLKQTTTTGTMQIFLNRLPGARVPHASEGTSVRHYQHVSGKWILKDSSHYLRHLS